ncbi:MAG: hypothetical protein Q9195_006973 [Heterodermia aff. obscurata]
MAPNPPKANRITPHSSCATCSATDALCPKCTARHQLSKRISEHDANPPKDSETQKDSTSTKEALQAFKDTHRTTRATSAQLEQIFERVEEEADREKVIDWLENPRALYPLTVGETVLDRAVGVVLGEREMPEGYVRARRGAVVAAHFEMESDELVLGRGKLEDGGGDARLPLAPRKFQTFARHSAYLANRDFPIPDEDITIWHPRHFQLLSLSSSKQASSEESERKLSTTSFDEAPLAHSRLCISELENCIYYQTEYHFDKSHFILLPADATE